MIKRTNGRRLGLLTEQEKINIGSENMNKRTLSKLYHKLNSRMEAVQEDFEIISNCRQLEPWRATNKTLLEGAMNSYQVLSTIPQTVYTTPVNYYSKTSGKKTKIRYYWLDRNSKQKLNIRENSFITNRIFDPDYALRKIRHNLKNREEIDVLKFAVKNNLLSTLKENALTIEDIKHRSFNNIITYQPTKDGRLYKISNGKQVEIIGKEKERIQNQYDRYKTKYQNT